MRADRIKSEVLAATPLSPEMLEEIKYGQSLPQDELMQYQRGVDRYRIEQTAGQNVTADLYDRLHTSRQRRDFRRLIDMLETPAARQQHDRDEAGQGVLLMQRTHVTRNCQIIDIVMTAVFGRDWLYSKETFTKEEICQRLEPVLAQYYSHIEIYIDTRPGLSRDPLNVLRRLVKRISLGIDGDQLMRNGVRFYVYGIDAEQRAMMLAYARVALQTRVQQREEALLQSVSEEIPYTDWSNKEKYIVKKRFSLHNCSKKWIYTCL